MDISKIKDDGFLLNLSHSEINDLAFISLRISLNAYFSTYRSLLGQFDLFGKTVDNIDSRYSYEYIMCSCESITHFHHFVELILKDILTKEPIILTIDASKELDEVKNNPDKIENYADVKQIEFSIALERIKNLINTGRIDKVKYGFILDAYCWLKSLNHLRNRISHRGLFVIRYKALDYLFGKYCLKYLQNICSLSEYNDYEFLWKYKRLNIHIDPIDEIVNSINEKDYQQNKIALLKEFGRASYNNPIINNYKFGQLINEGNIKRSTTFANSTLHIDNIDSIDECPVCGVKSLVMFYDSYERDDESGNQIGVSYYNYKVRCYCCSLEFDRELNKLTEMKLPIRNYWE